MVRQLKTYANGKHPGNFIEVMSCEGGCVAGPNVLSNSKLATTQLHEFVAAHPVGSPQQAVHSQQ
jgi:iron only hydrogenase large subunit-like protein